MSNARIYLRASTDAQDATRARQDVEDLAARLGLPVVGTYIENESGAKLARPELFKLLDHSRPGDVLLVEQVDRLSRLTDTDWRALRTEIDTRQIRVVALDLPTSHAAAPADETTARMLSAVNGMLLDMLAAMARKDYTDRRRRQAQGIATAKAAGKYRGRPEDTERLKTIGSLLARGTPWSTIQNATGCSRATVAKVAKQRRADAAAE